MGSPVSPLVANLFTEYLEQKLPDTAPMELKPRLWKRYVDDIFEVVKKSSVEGLTEFLNNLDDSGSINFTLLWPGIPPHVQMSSLRFSCFCLCSGETMYLQLHLCGCRGLRLPRCFSIYCVRSGRTVSHAHADVLIVALRKRRDTDAVLNETSTTADVGTEILSTCRAD